MGEGIPKCAFSRKRLRERFITFAGAVYNVCIRGCKRYLWRTHVFAFKVDQIGPGGCSALRLRWAKLAPKSSVLFWTREKGGETHLHTGHCLPSRINLVNRYLPARFGCFSRVSLILCGSVLFGVFQPQVHSLDVLHHTVQCP